MQLNQILLYLVAMTVSGCAAFYPSNQLPEVHLTKIKVLPRDGLEQGFLIGLTIVNTNNSALRISGMSYGLSLNGRKVASGVAGNLNKIAAYSESRVTVEARANLLSGLRVVTELLRSQNPEVEYQLEIRLRKAWWPVPLTLIEQGKINLDGFNVKVDELLGNE
jgi:LEA14-like dessication related protein